MQQQQAYEDMVPPVNRSCKFARSGPHPRGSAIAHAARRQRAVFAVPRPLPPSRGRQYRGSYRGRSRYPGNLYGRRQSYAPNRGTSCYPSSYRPTEPRKLNQHDEHYGYRGRAPTREKERRARRRSSRSLSPNARDRYDAYEDKQLVCFDYHASQDGPSGFEDYKSRSSNSRPVNYHDDSDDDWEDELNVLDQLNGSNGHRGRRTKGEELEYLRRMLTKFRNRHKELFWGRKQGLRTRIEGRGYQTRNEPESFNKYSGDHSSKLGQMTPPPSTSTSLVRYRQSESRAPSVAGSVASTTRINDSSSYASRNGGVHNYHEQVHNNRNRGNNMLLEGPPTAQNSNQLVPISNKLRAAVNSRSYPVRSFGRTLHINRWLSDRYSRPSKFDFGPLPKTEGIKKYYIQDPNNPDRFLNVPRPRQSIPGRRGDYYRGAAWEEYQQEKLEWLQTNGCNYPDVWQNSANGNDDISMTDSQSDITDADSSMSDVSDVTIKAYDSSTLEKDQYRNGDFDGLDLASEISHEDLISISCDNEADGGVMLTRLPDQSIEDISAGIQNTSILDQPIQVTISDGVVEKQNIVHRLSSTVLRLRSSIATDATHEDIPVSTKIEAANTNNTPVLPIPSADHAMVSAPNLIDVDWSSALIDVDFTLGPVGAKLTPNLIDVGNSIPSPVDVNEAPCLVDVNEAPTRIDLNLEINSAANLIGLNPAPAVVGISPAADLDHANLAFNLVDVPNLINVDDASVTPPKTPTIVPTSISRKPDQATNNVGQNEAEPSNDDAVPVAQQTYTIPEDEWNQEWDEQWKFHF